MAELELEEAVGMGTFPEDIGVLECYAMSLSTSGNPPVSLKWEEVPLATPTVETKMGFISKNGNSVHKNAARSSCRPKRPLITRYEDFLWVTCTSKTVQWTIV
jgi:hypothetical protein